MEDRRRMYSNPFIPPAYQQIEYVSYDGTQHIRTDYVPVIGDEIKIKFLFTGTNDYEGLLSAGNDTYQLILLKYGRSTESNFYYKYFASGGAKEIKWPLQVGAWHEISISSDGTASSEGYSMTSPPEHELDGDLTTLWLLRRRNSNYPCYGSLAYCTITNNGTEKLKLIPCLRTQDGHIGMYDTVSRTFYGNSGTRPFIPGPIVY